MGITFQPEQDQCLHVLRPDYSVVSGLSAEAYKWASVSNLSRIEPTTKSVPPPDIFGNEPEHTWCYYYEKADLADQFQDWHQVVSLWQQANQQGVWARNGIELLPFIRAYAMLNDWQTARKITIQASVLPDQQWPMLCALWQKSRFCYTSLFRARTSRLVYQCPLAVSEMTRSKLLREETNSV